MKKGEKSRAWIISESTRLMNSKGVNLTLNQLAQNLGISRGRISHYFKTKDSLFIAIAKEYEEKLGRINNEFNSSNKELTFQSLRKRYSTIMDHQFNYRCAITYIVCFGHSDVQMSKHIKETYGKNRTNIVELLRAMVQLGLLRKEILENDKLQVFTFEFINLFTTWVLHFNLYDGEEEYKKMKPIYLKGIMQCFESFKPDTMIA